VLSDRTIAIVGAGQSGYWAAKTLRTEGFAGRIVLVGAEPHPPYERPPLSKRVLRGEAPPQSAILADADALASWSIEFRRGCTVGTIDRAAARVELQSGERIAYDRLILTTGAMPRQLSAAEGLAVYYLRSLEDAVAIGARCRAGGRALIIGAGLIGMEVAASARALGCAVTVIEAGSRIMARAALPQASAYLAAVHADRGVVIRTDLVPVRIDGDDRCVRAVCSEGTVLEGDFLVIGIGIAPNEGLAAEAGLATGDGIWIDEHCRSSDPNIFAAGDVTCHLNPLLNRRVRLESWHKAQNQAIAAARNAMEIGSPYAEVPWGWSDQFSVNLQMLGSPHDVARTILRGDLSTGTFTVFAVDAHDRLVCVNALNAPRDIAISRRLFGKKVPADILGDAGRSLRELVV
jgi:3-phenylpropionate/trans-cinnamate dioxygenase ferredoxin reductase subunit